MKSSASRDSALRPLLILLLVATVGVSVEATSTTIHSSNFNTTIQSSRADQQRYLRQGISSAEDQSLDSLDEYLRQRHLAVDSKTIQRYKDAPTGQKLHPSYYSESYLPRALPYAKNLDDLAKEYGSWTFVDSKADIRPTNEFYDQFLHRDVPRNKFPDTAWQVDKDYLKEFLPQAIALVERAMEAILAEYGWSPKEKPDMSLEERSVKFEVTFLEKLHKASADNGGGMPEKSFKGLKRRLLHAIMSQDRFTFAMTGHSSSAGHGNLFPQSYTLQVQRILEPIMARLGVKMVARNLGLGGLGTLQTSLAAGDIMGRDVDIVAWDSGMTEKDSESRGVLALQSLLGGDRAPFLWFQRTWTELDDVHEKLGADVGIYGTGQAGGWPEVKSAEDAQNLPWAAEIFACPKELHAVCRMQEYYGKCWEDRSDFKFGSIDLSMAEPPVPQKEEPGGRAKWHPGNRHHQLQGRAFTYPILQALRELLRKWYDTPDFTIADEEWHVTDYYKGIKEKILENQDFFKEYCKSKEVNEKFCLYAANGRTEFTPRANPHKTSIRSIITGGYSTKLNTLDNLYDPPDVYQPSLFPPEGEVNALAIIENGVDFPKNLARIHDSAQDMKEVRFTESDEKSPVGSKHNNAIEGGLGWAVISGGGGSGCNGEHDSFCRRFNTDCLLYGHNDNRDQIGFDEYSGWLVMNLADMEKGLIVIKVHTWIDPIEATKEWCSVNNKEPCKQRALEPETSGHVSRKLGPPYCSDFALEASVDGKITKIPRTSDNFDGKYVKAQRVVELFELYNDDDFGEKRDVEFALRMTGCGRQKPFGLTHVYWM